MLVQIHLLQARDWQGNHVLSCSYCRLVINAATHNIVVLFCACCRLVIDKASSKPKGTAFVEYKTAEGAKKAADACTRGRCAVVLYPFIFYES
jgi:hypothetical protein